MRYFIIYFILIFLMPLGLSAQEVVSGRVSGYDSKKEIFYLKPMPCRQNCKDFILVKLPGDYGNNTLANGDIVRVSGRFLSKEKFEASFIMKYDSSDPTGVRSRLQNHKGHGKHRMHGRGHD